MMSCYLQCCETVGHMWCSWAPKLNVTPFTTQNGFYAMVLIICEFLN